LAPFLVGERRRPAWETIYLRLAFVGDSDWLNCVQIKDLRADPRTITAVSCTWDQATQPTWTLPADIMLGRLSCDVSEELRMVARILAEHRCRKWMAVVTSPDDHVIRRCIEHGAWGLLEASAGTARYHQTIRRVQSGRLSYPQDVLDRIVTRRGIMTLAEAPSELLKRLDEDERRLLQLLASGASLTSAAKQLRSSAATVARRKRRLMEKLDAPDLASLIRAAVRTGLVEL